MASAKKTAASNGEKQQLKKEIVDVLLKKTGLTLNDLYDTAQRRFIASNLDLLSASELKKFDSILLSTK